MNTSGILARYDAPLILAMAVMFACPASAQTLISGTYSNTSVGYTTRTTGSYEVTPTAHFNYDNIGLDIQQGASVKIDVGADLTNNNYGTEGGPYRVFPPSGLGYAVQNAGYLTVNGGSLWCQDVMTPQGPASGIAAILNVGNGSLTVNGGLIGNSNPPTGNNQFSAGIELPGGNVVINELAPATNPTKIHGFYGIVMDGSLNSLTINGGTFTSQLGALHTESLEFPEDDPPCVTTVNINGGTFIATGYQARTLWFNIPSVNSKSPGTVNIWGGVFSSAYSDFAILGGTVYLHKKPRTSWSAITTVHPANGAPSYSYSTGTLYNNTSPTTYTWEAGTNVVLL